MKRRFIIKKITAAFLLSVFLLGITPKKELHALLANHTDNTIKQGNGKTQQLTTAGFNCKCDDLVAQSNFLADGSFGIAVPNVAYHSYFTSFYSSFLSLSPVLFNLRGPPVRG